MADSNLSNFPEFSLEALRQSRPDVYAILAESIPIEARATALRRLSLGAGRYLEEIFGMERVEGAGWLTSLDEAHRDALRTSMELNAGRRLLEADRAARTGQSGGDPQRVFNDWNAWRDSGMIQRYAAGVSDAQALHLLQTADLREFLPAELHPHIPALRERTIAEWHTRNLTGALERTPYSAATDLVTDRGNGLDRRVIDAAPADPEAAKRSLEVALERLKAEGRLPTDARLFGVYETAMPYAEARHKQMREVVALWEAEMPNLFPRDTQAASYFMNWARTSPDMAADVWKIYEATGKVPESLMAHLVPGWGPAQAGADMRNVTRLGKEVLDRTGEVIDEVPSQKTADIVPLAERRSVPTPEGVSDARTVAQEELEARQLAKIARAEDAALDATARSLKSVRAGGKLGKLLPWAGAAIGGAVAAYVLSKAEKAHSEGKLTDAQIAEIRLGAAAFTATGAGGFITGIGGEEAIDARLAAIGVPEELRFGTLRQDIAALMSQRHGQFPPDARRLLVMMPGDPALSLDDATLDHLNQTKAQIVGLAIAAKTEPAKEQEHLARMDMKTGEFLRTAEVWLRRGGTVDKAEAAVTETMAVLREERAAEARENETLSASLVPGDDASPPRRQR